MLEYGKKRGPKSLEDLFKRMEGGPAVMKLFIRRSD